MCINLLLCPEEFFLTFSCPVSNEPKMTPAISCYIWPKTPPLNLLFDTIKTGESKLHIFGKQGDAQTPPTNKHSDIHTNSKLTWYFNSCLIFAVDTVSIRVNIRELWQQSTAGNTAIVKQKAHWLVPTVSDYWPAIGWYTRRAHSRRGGRWREGVRGEGRRWRQRKIFWIINKADIVYWSQDGRAWTWWGR